MRELSGASASLLGTKLMTEAFRTGGPLFDAELDPGESIAMMNLFQGAIGLFKEHTSLGRPPRLIRGLAPPGRDVAFVAIALVRRGIRWTWKGSSSRGRRTLGAGGGARLRRLSSGRRDPCNASSYVSCAHMTEPTDALLDRRHPCSRA